MTQLTEFDLSKLRTLEPLDMAQQQRAILIRNLIINDNDKPKYLLAIEVNQLLDNIEDQHCLMLIETLWNTGARINEVVQRLTPDDFVFEIDTNLVKLHNSKKINKKNTSRLVPLLDNSYIRNIKRYITTFNIKHDEPIFNIDRRTALNWLNKAVKQSNDKGVHFSINVNLKTFRHSYAMHLLYNGYPKKILQQLLGHSRAESTEVYINILAIEVVSKPVKFLY